MSNVGHQLLFVASVATLAGAGFRVAARTGAEGLERVVAAAVLAAAAAICESLVLGLVGLGTSAVALAVAAALSYAATLLVPGPRVGAVPEFAAWFRTADRRLVVAIAAIGGIALAWVGWNLYRPDIAIDGIYYHLPEIAGWVSSGHPGSVEQIHPWLHIGSYPLAHDVLLAWGFGISRSLVPDAFLSLALLLIAAAAAWVGLRELQVARIVRALAIAAVCTVPIAVAVVDGPLNDVAALSWLIVAGGLAATANRNPRLLAPMLVAAGLAIGTKTTTLPLTAVLVAVMFVAMRHRLRGLWPAIAAAAAVAFGVGAFWYVRDLVDHGSPFWPFAATSWGDPVPPLLDSFHSFLARPRATLEGNVGGYVTVMSGALVLLVAGVAAPLWDRSRVVIAGAGLTLASVVIWSAAPTSGVSDHPELSASISQTRYLLPAVAMAALTLALSARRGGRRRQVVALLLAAALAWNLGQILTGFFPHAFSKWWLAAGALVGAAVGLALVTWRASRSGQGAPWTARVRLVALGVVGVTAAIALAWAADGYLARYVDDTLYFDSPLVQWFDANAPDDHRPISMSPLVFGTLAADHFERTVSPIGVREPCPAVASRLQRGWVILSPNPLYRRLLHYSVNGCLSGKRPVATVGGIYRIYRPGE